MKEINVLLEELTIEEKAALLEGYQSWMTNAVPRLGIPSVYLTDGPLGVRKKTASKGAGAVGLGLALPSTAFPASVNIANSWNIEIAEQMGRAIGMECLDYDVDVLLAPAMNLKRDPRCGRNFEYYSEDPLLSGKMAAAFTQGLQSTGTAACPKHFAMNNCEQYRYMSDSVADERVVRELYLKAFEICVKESAPRTMMCAYNKLNGDHCSQNQWLLEEVLRGEWGYLGLMMTDWGATVDRVEGVRSGLDLDMPGGIWENRKNIIAAAKSGELPMVTLDRAVARVLRLVQDAQNKPIAPLEHDMLHRVNGELAIELAAESAVLLKNDGILPLGGGENLLVVGELFAKPRYQGAGSSGMNPANLISPKAAFTDNGIRYRYCPGYHEDSALPDKQWEDEALQAAADADTILFFGGLTDAFESEGVDRIDLSLPACQLRLLEKLNATGKKIVAVLFGGSAFEVPFADEVSAMIHFFLPGQGVGEACRRVLYGKVNPSGKLSETWMRSCEDIPYGKEFARRKIVPYQEGLYVGYRYYDLCPERIRFPFGFGLSYTTFDYRDLQIFCEGDTVRAAVTVTNTGSRSGAEVVQLYVGRNTGSEVHKAEKELRAFAKVFLAPGENKRVSLCFNRRDLAYYHTEIHNWVLENGVYPVLIGASSQDIRLCGSITVSDQPFVFGPYGSKIVQAYECIAHQPVSKELFCQTLQKPLPPEPLRRLYTVESPLSDFQSSPAGRFIYQLILKVMSLQGVGMDRMEDGPQKEAVKKSNDFTLRFLPGCSPRSMVQSSGGMVQMNFARALPMIANGQISKALAELAKVEKKIPLPCQEKKRK